MNLKAGGTSSSLAALISPASAGLFLGEQTAPIGAGCVAWWSLAAFALGPSDER
jgi:hypothetical protein